MTAALPSPIILPCGDPLDADNHAHHRSGCPLAAAETIAAEAVDRAAAYGQHQLLAALIALAEAGLLRDLADTDADDLVPGLLDELMGMGLLVEPRPHSRRLRPRKLAAVR